MAFEGEDARRWQMTDAPTLLPAVDFVTRSPNGPFLDTGINLTVEHKGRVYLSVETLREMAEIAGILDTRTAQEKSLYDIAIYNKGFEDGLKGGSDLIGKLDSVLSAIHSGSGDVLISGASVVEAGKDSSNSESGESDSNSDDVPEIAARSRKPRGKTSATVSVGGPDDIPSLSDDNEPFEL